MNGCWYMVVWWMVSDDWLILISVVLIELLMMLFGPLCCLLLSLHSVPNIRRSNACRLSLACCRLLCDVKRENGNSLNYVILIGSVVSVQYVQHFINKVVSVLYEQYTYKYPSKNIKIKAPWKSNINNKRALTLLQSFILAKCTIPPLSILNLDSWLLPGMPTFTNDDLHVHCILNEWIYHLTDGVRYSTARVWLVLSLLSPFWLESSRSSSNEWMNQSNLHRMKESSTKAVVVRRSLSPVTNMTHICVQHVLLGTNEWMYR